MLFLPPEVISMVTLKSALDDFLLQKRLAGVGLNSIGNYRSTITLMLRFVGSDLPVSELSYDKAAEYILSVVESPISRATVSSYIRNVRIFLRWLHETYGLSFDPSRIKVPKSPKKRVYIYNDDEIRQIFSLVRTSVPWITARNRAIIALMLDSGLRQCEVCSLCPSDIDRSRMVMKVTGKGAKDRMVPLGRFSLSLLDDYLSSCPYSSERYVFLTVAETFFPGMPSAFLSIVWKSSFRLNFPLTGSGITLRRITVLTRFVSPVNQMFMILVF